MSAFTVDASVAAKWFLIEDLSAEALRLLRRDKRLHAPDFLLLEMDNLFWKRVRRGDMTPALAIDTRALLRQIPIQFHPFSALEEDAYRIAHLTGRTVYDSLYIALATVLRAPLVTADRRLHAALASGPYAGYVLWAGCL